MKKKKINLEEFVKKSQFSDDLYRQIFSELVAKYKNETPRQHLIRAVILIWERNYPREFAWFQDEMNKVKETRTNEFAADVKADMQLTFRFPRSLFNRLKLIVKDPEFLASTNEPTKEDKEEVAWLTKNFPEFLVPKKF